MPSECVYERLKQCSGMHSRVLRFVIWPPSRSTVFAMNVRPSAPGKAGSPGTNLVGVIVASYALVALALPPLPMISRPQQ